MSAPTFERRAKDLVWRARLVCRSFIGRDVYYREEIRRPKQVHGGRPRTGFGAWTICPVGLTAESIVYSLGVGDDISFDLSLISAFGLKIYAFDPTPTALAWLKKQNAPPQFKVFEYAIADADGQAKFYPNVNPDFVSHSLIPGDSTTAEFVNVEVRTLETVMAQLGHDHIDLLKIDIEGAEYPVLKNLVASGIRVRQLLVEFHHSRPEIGLHKTKESLDLLRGAGYKILHVSPRGEEYTMLKD